MIKRIIGGLMLSIALVAVFSISVIEHGLKEAAITWGILILFAAFIIIGTLLLLDD